MHWSEVENVGHRGGRQRIETVEYSDNEDYFQYKFSLWQGGGKLCSYTSCHRLQGQLGLLSVHVQPVVGRW